MNQDDSQMDFRVRARNKKWAKMESSRRYLLQAEIEYWHEMLHSIESRVSKLTEEEMRRCLKRAVRAMNSNYGTDFQVAA